jgi:hypothetical protein
MLDTPAPIIAKSCTLPSTILSLAAYKLKATVCGADHKPKQEEKLRIKLIRSFLRENRGMEKITR